MSYKALYRKYRSAIFDQVIGQEHVTETLKNQIKNDRVAHAYLFCGIRGTGKTSIAKIFAKAVNCENNKNGNPCLECDICKSGNENVNVNIIEIDAASNNGVDNIREIREEVNYMPTKGKYKVYIIDEVHMLSTSAFNALLKTLEEPPKHIIFILATTEPQKIPATILSRCQRFDLKRITVADIIKNLKMIIKEENLSFDERALKYIANLADGSMRDALSIMDKMITFSMNDKITLNEVQNILGIVDEEVFAQLLLAINNKESGLAIQKINDIYMGGKDISQFVSQMINYLRNLMIVSSVHNSSDILDISEESLEKLKELVKVISYEKILGYIKEFCELDNKAKYDNHPKVLLELKVLKMCQPMVGTDDSTIMKRIETIENYLRKQAKKNEILKDEVPIVKESINEIKYNIEKEKDIEKEEVKNDNNKKIVINKEIVTDDLNTIKNMWVDIRESFKEPMKSLLRDSKITQFEQNKYCIVVTNDVTKSYINNKMDDITSKIKNVINSECMIDLITQNEFDKNSSVNNQSNNEGKYNSDGIESVENMFKSLGVDFQTVD